MLNLAWSRDMTRESNHAFFLSGIRFFSSRFEDRPIEMAGLSRERVRTRRGTPSGRTGRRVMTTAVGTRPVSSELRTKRTGKHTSCIRHGKEVGLGQRASAYIEKSVSDTDKQRWGPSSFTVHLSVWVGKNRKRREEEVYKQDRKKKAKWDFVTYPGVSSRSVIRELRYMYRASLSCEKETNKREAKTSSARSKKRRNMDGAGSFLKEKERERERESREGLGNRRGVEVDDESG